jgi:hypothetical protein
MRWRKKKERRRAHIYISTNNIAIGLVRVRKIRFRPTQNTLSYVTRPLALLLPEPREEHALILPPCTLPPGEAHVCCRLEDSASRVAVCYTDVVRTHDLGSIICVLG